MNAYQQLASDLVATRRLATSREHLRYSSLEDGSVPQYDFGQLVSIWGRQWDGAHGILTVAGPTPPRPSAPNVTVVPGAVLVEVQGTFYDGPTIVAPSDFKQFEVFVSTDSTAVLDREVYRGAIASARGGQVRVDLDYDETYYVWIATRSNPGNFSEPSPVVGPFVIPRAVAADLDIDDIVGNKVHYGPSTPTAIHGGDLWLKWVNSPIVPAQYELYRWDGDSWDAVADQTAVAAALAASNAQAAADLKVRLYSQDTAPAGLGAADKAIWQDTNDGNKGYIWDGDSWEPRLLGNSAISPASLVASTVLVTGSVTAALLEAIMVLATTIIAGDAGGEHTRIDSTGVSNYALVDGLPIELGRQGRGWSVRDPATGDVVAATTDTGVGSFSALSVQDDDITVGGITMAERDWERPWGMVGYAELPDINLDTTATNSELGFLEIAFDPVPGRAYKLHSEPVQFDTATGTGIRFKVRRTVDGSTPSTSSPLLREVAYLGGAAWHDRQAINLYLGGTAAVEEWRLLLTYGTGNGSTGATVWRGEVMFFWIEDIGPLRENIGVLIGGSSGGGTGGGSTAPKVTRTVEYGATWVRTWAQNSTTVIEDNQMHQGYGDSFNGNRRASAGFTSLTSLLSGAVINSAYIYMESFHWWNMSGGTCRLGYHGDLSEPATFPGHLGINNVGFTARAQGKWIRVDGWSGWKTAMTSGAFRGISIGGADNSAIYYGKFYGVPNGRPRIKITYTK
jgi:hypothetical protein